VVTDAKEALEKGDVNLVLVWVNEDDEAEVRKAFEDTLEVRKLGAEAKELADRYFLETLVRVHRSSEGEPFTGLKPAGRDLGPAIPAADRALESGNVDPLEEIIVEAVRHGLRERFDRALAAKEYPANEVKEGREFVEAYVSFVHYAEGLYEAAHAQGHYAGHGEESASHSGESGSHGRK